MADCYVGSDRKTDYYITIRFLLGDVPSFLHVLTAFITSSSVSRKLDVPSFLHVLKARHTAAT